MSTLKNRLAEKIPAWREDVRTLAKEHGDVVLGEATVAKALTKVQGLPFMSREIEAAIAKALESIAPNTNDSEVGS